MIAADFFTLSHFDVILQITLHINTDVFVLEVSIEQRIWSVNSDVVGSRVYKSIAFNVDSERVQLSDSEVEVDSVRENHLGSERAGHIGVLGEPVSVGLSAEIAEHADNSLRASSIVQHLF